MSKLNLFLLFNILILSGCYLSQSMASNETYITQPTKTINPTSGTITGRLLILNSEKKTPINDEILYLAEVIFDNEGKSSFASFDRINSPRTTTDSEGKFIFENIKPGKYGLVLDVITASYLLLKPGTTEPIIIEVTGGDIIDLGELTFEELPITK